MKKIRKLKDIQLDKYDQSKILGGAKCWGNSTNLCNPGGRGEDLPVPMPGGDDPTVPVEPPKADCSNGDLLCFFGGSSLANLIGTSVTLQK